MIKIVLVFLSSLFLLSYDNFISDGNSSDYVRLEHIVNTTENKIYLAIGVKDIAETTFELVKIDALGPNVLIEKVEDITADFKVSKFLALKDEENKYNGEFILAGQTPRMDGKGRLEHFSYSADTYTAKKQQTFPSVYNILDIVQKPNGGDLYFVSNKDTIVNHELTVEDKDPSDDFEDRKTIYERYLNINPVALAPKSYLVEIDQGNIASILREFSYNLDINQSSTTPEAFFTLGFDSVGGNITIIGSTPINNAGSKLIALSVNASKINTKDTEPPELKFPDLIPPKYALPVSLAKDADVPIGSIAIYGDEYNESNAEQKINDAFQQISLPGAGNASTRTMVRDGNISELIEGYYNTTLGPPYDKVINWLDLDCEKKTPPEKYLVPWKNTEIAAITNLTNQKVVGKTNQQLCITNDKFIYQVPDANETRIRRQWQYIYDDETPLLWMKNIPNDKIIGNPLRGKIETITTDNTSVAMIHQENDEIGGINLLRIIDSTPDVEDRLKWHKTYRTGQNTGNNESKVIIHGPNLLKTIANDFIVTGEARDLTRTDSKRFNCMVIKFDKNGNELWTRDLGGFHDDSCYSVVLEKNNTSPFYNDYIAVGNSGTRNPDDDTDRTSYAVKFRDEGTLIHAADGWSLIANGTDRNITAQGKKENSDTIGIINLGAYRSYFQFINNQWLINQYPIEPLTGFWMYTIDGRHDIFLEGNLLEQKFETTDLGWVLLGTGVQLIKAQQKYNLDTLWKFTEQRWIENPIVINPGEGFWAKKKR